MNLDEHKDEEASRSDETVRSGERSDGSAADGAVSRPVRERDQYERFVKQIVEHEPAVRSYLRGLLPHWHDVDEVIQEASLVAWRKFSEFEEGTSFGGWLLTIARFEALHYRRRIARSPLVFDEQVWSLLEEECRDSAPESIVYLEECLSKLDEPRRRLLLQAHTPGIRMRDLAERAGKNEQAFYKTIQRMRKSLLQCISRAMSAEAM